MNQKCDFSEPSSFAFLSSLLKVPNIGQQNATMLHGPNILRPVARNVGPVARVVAYCVPFKIGQICGLTSDISFGLGSAMPNPNHCAVCMQLTMLRLVYAHAH